jgi:hypothetical protein
MTFFSWAQGPERLFEMATLEYNEWTYGAAGRARTNPETLTSWEEGPGLIIHRLVT